MCGYPQSLCFCGPDFDKNEVTFVAYPKRCCMHICAESPAGPCWSPSPPKRHSTLDGKSTKKQSRNNQGRSAVAGRKGEAVLILCSLHDLTPLVKLLWFACGFSF